MMEVTNMEVTKKERRHAAPHGEARLPAQRPVLLYYAIARHGQDGPRLHHVPLGFGEEALMVFSSGWEAGRGYYVSRRRFLSEVFSEEWYVRKCSTGELVSLLFGPYKIGSTRLNSSHANISYAVFCLKKKRSAIQHYIEEIGLQDIVQI